MATMGSGTSFSSQTWPNAVPVHCGFATVNNYTVHQKYLMLVLEHELGKISTSRYFGNFDLSHGYWKLPSAV